MFHLYNGIPPGRHRGSGEQWGRAIAPQHSALNIGVSQELRVLQVQGSWPLAGWETGTQGDTRGDPAGMCVGQSVMGTQKRRARLAGCEVGAEEHRPGPGVVLTWCLGPGLPRKAVWPAMVPRCSEYVI